MPIMCRHMRLLCLLSIAFQVAPACSLSYRISAPDLSADPLFRFSDGKRVGYIDPKGKVVIPATAAPDARIHDGGEFHDGLLKLSDGLSWFVDQLGNPVTAKFYDATDFSDGLAAVQPIGLLKWGYINRTGDLTIPAVFDASPGPFSEGLARVELSGRTGYIDRAGNFAIPAVFSYGSDFHEGFATALIDGPCRIINPGSCAGPRFGPVGSPSGEVDGKRCKLAFIDHSGKTISEDRYDGTGVFSEGLAAVEAGGKWGYIDKTGKLAIDTVFEWAGSFSGGLARADQHGKTGFINRTGLFAIPPQFSSASDFSNGLAVVGSDLEGYWYIGRDGKPAFPGRFALATSFVHGLAHVGIGKSARKVTKFAYLDTAGRAVFRYSIKN
jgi:hypothetical protein